MRFATIVFLLFVVGWHPVFAQTGSDDPVKPARRTDDPTLDVDFEEITEALDEWRANRGSWIETIWQGPPKEWNQMLVALGYQPHPDQTKEFTVGQLEELIGTEANLATLRNATVGSFYFLKVKEGHDFQRKLSDYERLSDPAALPAKDLKTVIKKLSDARKYGWLGARTGCIPSPGIALELRTDEAELTVVFCFNCSQLCFYHEEVLIGSKRFIMMRTTLVRVLKSVYPDNEQIQKLPRSR